MFFFFYGDEGEDRLAREVISAALREVADAVCREHYNSISQEPQITSRIGQALEQRMKGFEYRGYRIEVISQDFPDRGPGALEGKVGADIYVGVRVILGTEVLMTKGFLAQAKLQRNLRITDSKMPKQCEDMLARTDAAYVWIYTSKGVQVLRADQMMSRKSPRISGSRRLDQVLSETLGCNEGDREIGIPPGPDVRSEVGAMLKKLSVQTAISIDIFSPLPIAEFDAKENL